MNCFTTKWIYIFIPLFLFNYFSIGQDIPEIEGKDLPDFSNTRNEIFDGSSLWGYMNGGADIYLEYGFEVLRVQGFTGGDENVKMEIYKMQNPAAAFGIYSIKTFRCKESGLLTAIDCLNPYQFQILYGDHYISIINESGSEKAKQMMLEIAQKIIPELESKETSLPCSWLTDSLGLSLQEIKMIRDPLGIMNKANELSALFEGMNGYQVYYARIDRDKEKYKVYEIVFEDAAMKDHFKEAIPDEDFQFITDRNKNIVMRRKR
ncbi:MAG: DUF6599 family protein [Bacteroidota bacterium]|nr:DUF6599 family protein [Bacteroidota bacterium]